MLNKGSSTTDQTNPALLMDKVGLRRLVSTLHPALEDNSIDGDKAGALRPHSGHLDTPSPQGRELHQSTYTEEEADERPVRSLKHGLDMCKAD